jgi:hypothetical protein
VAAVGEVINQRAELASSCPEKAFSERPPAALKFVLDDFGARGSSGGGSKAAHWILDPLRKAKPTPLLPAGLLE